jgi:RimJ/RimL family protein N-acetyltransferase
METDFDPRPTILQGERVRLEPLGLGHADDLFHAGREEEIWRYLPVPPARNVEETRDWIRKAAAAEEQGHEIPFAIVLREGGRAVGSTRYMDIQRDHRGLEIGWTWLGPPWQRSGVNRECKRLLMSHAFDELGAERVCFKTDSRNVVSQRAIESLGAQWEGVLRHHRFCWDGTWRDTVYYGVLASEWPGVKSRL